MHCVVDASYVSRIANEIMQAHGSDDAALGHSCLYGCNGDLWSRFIPLWRERRHAGLAISWSPAHATAEHIQFKVV